MDRLARPASRGDVTSPCSFHRCITSSAPDATHCISQCFPCCEECSLHPKMLLELSSLLRIPWPPIDIFHPPHVT